MSRPRKYTEEERKEKHQQYNADYDKANTTRLAVKLNNSTDKDILNFLSTIPNKQGYIKDLIRSDMAARLSDDGQSLDSVLYAEEADAILSMLEDQNA
jgi:hypothetical protein